MRALLAVIACLSISLMLMYPSVSGLGVNIPKPAASTINNSYTTINNIYINQSVNATVNTTQFDSANPLTISTTWLTIFITNIANALGFYPNSNPNSYLNYSNNQWISQATSTSTAYKTCYQESANVSNQTGIDTANCGLDYSGSYADDGNWSGTAYLSYDGNWGTFTDFPTNDPNIVYYYVYINYTKPISSQDSSIWQTATGINKGIHNYSLMSCWSAYSDKLVLRLGGQYKQSGSSHTQGDCFNGTAWVNVYNIFGGGGKLLEEAIYWNVSYSVTNYGNYTLTANNSDKLDGLHASTFYNNSNPYGYYNSSTLPVDNSSDLWTQGTGNIYPTTITDNVLIGTTTDDTVNKLQVAGTATIDSENLYTSSLLLGSQTLAGANTPGLAPDLVTSPLNYGTGMNKWVFYDNPGGASYGIGMDTGTGFTYYSGDFGHTWFTGATYIDGTGATEKMRLTNGGNLLIGTTTDDGVNKLQVAGDFAVGNRLPHYPNPDTNNYRQFVTGGLTFLSRDAGTNALGYGADSYFSWNIASVPNVGNLYFANDYAGEMAFNALPGVPFVITVSPIGGAGDSITSNVGTFGISSNGNVLIGTTTDVPLYKTTIKTADVAKGGLYITDGSTLGENGISGYGSLLTLGLIDGNTDYQLGYSSDAFGQVANFQGGSNNLDFDFANATGSGTGTNWLLSSGGYAMHNIQVTTGGYPAIGNTAPNTIGFGLMSGGTIDTVGMTIDVYNGNLNVAGNVLIGTTSDDGVNKLQVNGNGNFTGNITAKVYHGMIDWINVPISITLTGTTACTNLNNLVSGYNYTCQTCTNSLTGGTIACSTIASVMENCACKTN